MEIHEFQIWNSWCDVDKKYSILLEIMRFQAEIVINLPKMGKFIDIFDKICSKLHIFMEIEKNKIQFHGVASSKNPPFWGIFVRFQASNLKYFPIFSQNKPILGLFCGFRAQFVDLYASKNPRFPGYFAPNRDKFSPNGLNLSDFRSHRGYFFGEIPP